MLKLHKREGVGTAAFYEADGPLTARDVDTLKRHHWISLLSGNCRMWWQGDGRFLFNNRGMGGDKRVPYDAADPHALAHLNAAWVAFTNPVERWFAFRAYNTETLYGYGTAGEAARFACLLNDGREVNVYGEYPLPEAEAAAENLEDRSDTFRLDDELTRRAEDAEG